MNTLAHITTTLRTLLADTYNLSDQQRDTCLFTLNVDKDPSFGDISCNAALILAKTLKQKPNELAQEIATLIINHTLLQEYIASYAIAGPGFINLFLTKHAWETTARELFTDLNAFMRYGIATKPKKYLLEYVSANPTGPLHLGHGRGGIIGDVLATLLQFVGYEVSREFYINDAGSQMLKLGNSLRTRCLQKLGHQITFPEDGYAGEYLILLAEHCINEYGDTLLEQSQQFFIDYAKTHLLAMIKSTLTSYRVLFDRWFSEKTLHTDGAINDAIALLLEKELVYEKDGALWFKSTLFGDDKDRVIRKQDGELTYIAADIAYHKQKFDRGFTNLIDILGQDHHGYVRRLKATMAALGYPDDKLDVILYQLVTITKGDEAVRMSKRAGNFTELQEIIDTVGVDVARFFYLHRKADAHLEFDLATALKKTDENPVYYVQYAYVRCNSIFEKARALPELAPIVAALERTQVAEFNHAMHNLGTGEIALLKKIASLHDIIATITTSYQTHLLTYYVIELAGHFHNYYAHHRIIDSESSNTSTTRLAVLYLIRNTFGLCLELLGLSKPEKM